MSNIADRGWERPHLPPGGIVRECLLPDGCESCDDPIMLRPLEPLARFDLPQLRSVGVEAEGWDPLASLENIMAKEWAGLAHECRPSASGLRDAFANGKFTKQHRAALDWAFAGMRRKYVFPGLVDRAMLPIFEVVRCFWLLFDGYAYGCGPWLNQWADDPDKPHPCVEFRRSMKAEFPQPTAITSAL